MATGESGSSGQNVERPVAMILWRRGRENAMIQNQEMVENLVLGQDQQIVTFRIRKLRFARNCAAKFHVQNPQVHILNNTKSSSFQS